MCAIFGLLNIEENRYTLKDLLTCMQHRGPDQSSFYKKILYNDVILLGHNRLEILDIAGGQQPMQCFDKTHIIVFNGEIYNHQELRKELISKGYSFISNHSDTEVLLNGYKEWGDDLPNHLNGMWAFCIFDTLKRKLFLSRDRFGEKPLFYKLEKNTLIFSSELNFFKEIANINLEINYKNIQKYCGYGFFPKNITPYNNIFKLEPGHNLVIDMINKKNEINKFWEYKTEPNFNKNIADWTKEIKFLLNKSVRNRMLADVPVGVFLSGGLDSSIIALLASNKNQKIKTFSIGFDQEEFDESQYSNLISKKINSDHYNYKIKINDINQISYNLLKKIDEPISDSSLISYFTLCKLASSKVKVVLGGDSADELMGGYDTIKAMRYLNIMKILKIDKINPLALNLLSKIKNKYGNMNIKFKLERFLRFSGNSLGYANPQWLSPMKPDEISEIFNMKISKEEIYEDSIELWNQSNLDNIDKSIEFYSKIFLQDQILVKTDRLSMMHGLEVRSPFLDYDLVDCLRQIPNKYKLNNNISKYILKKTFEKDFNKDFIYRKKMGFSTPISKWIISNNQIQFKSKTLTNKLKMISKKIIDHKSLKSDNRIYLWNLIMLDNFLSKNNL